MNKYTSLHGSLGEFHFLSFSQGTTPAKSPVYAVTVDELGRLVSAYDVRSITDGMPQGKPLKPFDGEFSKLEKWVNRGILTCEGASAVLSPEEALKIVQEKYSCD